MPPKELTYLAPLLVLLLALPGRAGAQEVGVMAGRGNSDFVELGSPSSLAAQVAVPIDQRGIFRVVGAYRSSVDTGTRPGTICDFYLPQAGCVDEPVAHETRLSQWEGGLAVGLPLTDRIEARASALRVRNTLTGSSEGAVTGRTAGAFYPTDTVWSTAWVGSFAWRIGSTLPVSLVGQVRSESLEFRGCAEHVGIPFCAEETLTTLELGVLFRR